ncbi:4'-phosphopantetheinyl transferase superfamily protein [Planktotalea sp.]|uniref:4'-phosphopantetheinyl transferase family protein n=1 Tax=Planktotalea sp. TaxID=2029877 RepID=UPI0032981374
MSVETALKDLLPKTAHFAVRDPKQTYPLLGTEKHAVAHAVEKRRTEFSAGRDAARAALSQLGMDGVEVPVGERRAPVWPDGICGTITHSRDICIAAVAQKSDFASIGIDAERATPLKDDLRCAILHDSELHVSGAKAIELFSMKEALFKALYPLTGELMGFHAAKSDDAEALILTRWVGKFAPATRFAVPTRHVDGHVISLCAVEKDVA